MGISWIGIVSPWWSSSISFVHALIFGVGISEFLYFLLSNPFAPLFTIIYLFAITDLLNLSSKKKRFILMSFSLIGVAFEVAYFYALFTDISLIGTLISQIDVQYKGFTVLFLLFSIIIILISGISFAKIPLTSKDPENSIKGGFLLIAFFCYFIGGILDSSLPLSILTLLITRTLLIISAISFSNGFLLSKWLKKKIRNNQM